MILNLIMNLMCLFAEKTDMCCYRKLLGMPKRGVTLQTTDFFIFTAGSGEESTVSLKHIAFMCVWLRLIMLSHS